MKHLTGGFADFSDVSGRHILVALSGGADSADLSHFGVPSIDSLGVEGGNIHSVNEYAYLRSLAESAKRMAAVAYCI